MRFSTFILASMAAVMGSCSAILEWQVEFFTESDCTGEASAIYASGSAIEDSGCTDIDSTVAYKSANFVANSNWEFELGDKAGCQCSSSFHGIEECPQIYYGNDIGTGQCLTDISNWKSWAVSETTT